MSLEGDINRLPDELLIKIFQDYIQLDLCRLSSVCQRFQKIVEDYLLWKSLYQKVYKYDQPLFHLESRKFQFESPDVSKYKNPWKESFKQLYRGVHVRPDFQNLTIGGHNVQCFDTIHEALSYVNNIEEDPSSQHLIFVHSGIHNVDDTIIIESNVALIGAATGPKHEIAKSVIINGCKKIIHVSSDLKRVYVGYMTLQISVTIGHILDCSTFLWICDESTPTIEHCIFRSANNNVDFAESSSVIVVSGYGANPLVRNCDISVSKVGLTVIDMAQGIYKDNIFNNETVGISVANYASPIIRRNNIQNSICGILIFQGNACLENNNIHNNEIGLKIVSNLQPSIRENNIYDNSQSGMYIDSSNSLIENNSIYNNADCGIVINASYVTVRRNKIYHNRDGICVQIRSNGVIEENEIYENSLTNVLIRAGAMPTVKQNQIYGTQCGVHFNCNSYGILEENTIYSHSLLGIIISKGSNPVIRKNTVRNNKIGLLVFSNSFDSIRQSCMSETIRDGGRIEDNTIYDNELIGIHIASNSDAIVRHNKIYRNDCGVRVDDKSRGLIEENKIYDNFSFNVLVTTESEPILKRNRIRNKQIGVHFNCANGKLEENDIYDHTCSGIQISNGSDPEIIGNRIRNNQEGVLVCDSGFGVLEHNYIFNSTTDNVKIINSEPILEYNQIFQARNCGINIQEGEGFFKQNYIFENNHAGVHIVATRSQPILKGNMIFCNGGIAGVEITGSSRATLELNTIFSNRCDGLWLEKRIPNNVIQKGRHCFWQN